MNNQEAFDHVKVNLLKQNKRSLNHNDDGVDLCAYRSKSGKCAIGWLIPDEIYITNMESCSSVYELCSEFPKLKIIFNDISAYLLERLQHLHDWSSPEEWEREFDIIAKDFNLISNKFVMNND